LRHGLCCDGGSTVTFVISYAYTVTHVTAKILHILTNIIRDIGLDPSKLGSTGHRVPSSKDASSVNAMRFRNAIGRKSAKAKR